MSRFAAVEGTMGARRSEGQLQLPMALGGQLVEHIRNNTPSEEIAKLAEGPDAQKALEAVQYVMSEPPVGAFLHSWLCSMSLPTQRPKGDEEFSPIVRREGNHTLVIKPGERTTIVNGKVVQTKVGVPYGHLARLIMIYIMTQAVKTRSPKVFLGNSLSAFLRRMGLDSVTSGGPRGSRTKVMEQLDRLMACQFTFRRDVPAAPEFAAQGRGRGGRSKTGNAVTAFAVSDVRMINQYGGLAEGKNEFVCEFVLSDVFYENLIKHSVPFNERAIAQIKRSATQIDLYTFLAYRLPKIQPGDEVILSWEQLKTHLGNDSKNLFKFRQTVRQAWAVVSGVYQQARHSVSFDELRIHLRHAEAPVDNQITRRSDGTLYLASMRPSDDDGTTRALPSAANTALPGEAKKAVRFPPSGSIRWGSAELYEIARRYGGGNDVDIIADGFRRALGSDLSRLEGEQLLTRFTAYCRGCRPV